MRMEENDDQQDLPAKATEDDILKEVGAEPDDDEEEDSFVYLKSSSIISILIITMITLVCLLATGLLIKAAVRTQSITSILSHYFGFNTNRTIDESPLTFWAPRSADEKQQPIETTTTMASSSSSVRPPPVTLSHREKKTQTTFRNIFLPSLFIISILCGILAFYMRLHHHSYPAWGARPRRPKQYVTIEMKLAQTAAVGPHDQI